MADEKRPTAQVPAGTGAPSGGGGGEPLRCASREAFVAALDELLRRQLAQHGLAPASFYAKSEVQHWEDFRRPLARARFGPLDLMALMRGCGWEHWQVVVRMVSTPDRQSAVWREVWFKRLAGGQVDWDLPLRTRLPKFVQFVIWVNEDVMTSMGLK